MNLDAMVAMILERQEIALFKRKTPISPGQSIVRTTPLHSALPAFVRTRDLACIEPVAITCDS